MGATFHLHCTAESAESVETVRCEQHQLLRLRMNVGMLTFGVTDDTGPQFTLHYGAVTAGKPREDKAIAAGRRRGKRLAKGVAVYFDGRAELRPGPMKTRDDCESIACYG
jgi:hypothetical protein